uniref:Uncharacterized protein n=1 Tax=Aegilops tauschii subsp. strangulata TaxID=200361 RepID=A0A453T8H8_AEGTS
MSPVYNSYTTCMPTWLTGFGLEYDGSHAHVPTRSKPMRAVEEKRCSTHLLEKEKISLELHVKTTRSEPMRALEEKRCRTHLLEKESL